MDIGALLGIANEANSLFGSLKGKLLRQPDEAAAKLAAVFDELTKIFQFIETETVSYLSIHLLLDGSNIVECRKTLLAMEGGQLMVKGDEARGHCHKIENIYQKHLKRWFHELLNGSNEEDQLRQLFDKLSDMDDIMTRGMKSACDWLQNEAFQTLNDIETGQFAAANMRIATARGLVLPSRRENNEALRALRGLQADFIAASGTV